MKLYEAQNIIKEVFENSFDKDKFTLFIRNLLKNLKLGEDYRAKTGYNIPKAFSGFISLYERVGKYEDEEGNQIDVLIVKLNKTHSIDFARSKQRSFVRWYLNNKMREGALVAFHSEKSADWRFSFIKMQYSLEKKKDELTPAKRFSFMVGEKGKSHTPQRQLINILKNDYAPTLADIEEAFNIEAVSDEFYEKYKSLLFDLVDAINKTINKDKSVKTEFDEKSIDVIDFSKKLLGQVVFLYFLQRKGWLGLEESHKYGDGDKHFLRNLFNKVKPKENFFNDYLEYLFYDALSRKRVTDYYKKFDTRIPFLNGGLFDPLNFYDWQKTDIIIPNNIFSDRKGDDEGTGILDIFDLYNFTVKEDEPLEKEVAIDPEMLGKVFERMLEVKKRKEQGAFYTPREIVHYMAQNSLMYYLESTTNINKTDLEIFIHYGEHVIDKDIAIEEGIYSQNGNKQEIPASVRNNASEIDKALQDIKICDPAVGSGAFPVGVMNEIVKLRILLSPFVKVKKDRDAYHFKANAIQNSIYGIDIDAGAVEIAKLRLWLSMVVDENRIDDIEPLPNLDYKIVKGNSLLTVPEGTMRDTELEKEIEALTKSYYQITDKSKKEAEKKRIDEKIQKYFNSTSEYLAYKIDFDYKLIFHEVFNINNGFDLVIGNPPYIKEATDKSAFDGTHEQECYQGKMDIWYLFGCKGIDILKDNTGLLSFIATNNWITNSGASKLRNKVLRNTQIYEFIDFGDYKVFQSAAIQTMVMFLAKNNNNENYVCNYSKVLDKYLSKDELDAFLIKTESKKYCFYQASIIRNELLNNPIHFLEEQSANILFKIQTKSNMQLLESEVASGIDILQDFVNSKSQIKLGSDIQVGDGIFNITTKELEELNLLENELSIIKPFFTTKELFKYYGDNKNKLWVIYTDSRFKAVSTIKPYPNIKRHLDKYKKVLTSVNKPYGLHRARNEYFFIGNKIISLRKCSKFPQFTYVNFDSYVNRTFIIIKTGRINLKYLTALLNSRLMAFWLKYKGKMQGDNYQVDKEPLLSIPILKIENNKSFEILVDYILFLKSQPKDDQSFYFEQIIDGMVYELYFEKEVKKAGRDILKYLHDLPEITDEMNDSKKQQIITDIFNKLYDKNSPVRNNLFYMKSIEEIRVIEESLKK